MVRSDCPPKCLSSSMKDAVLRKRQEKAGWGRNMRWVDSRSAVSAQRGSSGAMEFHRETLASRLSNHAQTQRTAGQDQVARAKGGDTAPVYVREELMHDMLGLLALANHRHVVLVGDAGVGRRSLVQGLALLMAEGKGPADLGNLVTVSEHALLIDAEKAVDSAAQRHAMASCSSPMSSAFSAVPRPTLSSRRQPGQSSVHSSICCRSLLPAPRTRHGMTDWRLTAPSAKTVTGYACRANGRGNGQDPRRPQVPA